MRRAVPFLLLPLAVAACGGSGKSSSTTTVAAPTPAEFVEAGNAVCKAADRRIFEIGRLSRDPKGWAATARSARKAVVDMRKVTPPPGRRAAFNEMVRFANALSLTIQEIHQALLKNDIDTAAAGQFAAGQLQDKVHQAARRVGLTFCQQTLTNWPA